MDEKRFENVHWADNSAKRVLDVFPDNELYTVASGITPSGIIHVGHFREIMTSELVRRALEDKGKKTKFIYSWDAFDAFRKVPKGLAKEFGKPESFLKEYEQYLRLSDANVPDPCGKHKSFAHHYMETAEETFKPFNFPIDFQYQNELQSSGVYAEGIKEYLNMVSEIRDLINKHRTEDRQLADDWFPLEIYSEKTNKDTTTFLDYDGEYGVTYRCDETGFENTIDFRKTPIVKLAWRLDWPMRWAYYDVTFEPGGKDHSTPGGSFDTGKDIVRLVSNHEPPVYTAYEFVRMKGFGGKISSSAGNGATISDVLGVYTPEMILFLFAGTRPNAELDISFDLDVIKIYEDFDSLERFYYGLEEEKNPKKAANLRRVYELSMNIDETGKRETQKEIPFQPSFRHLVNVAQAKDFDFEKVLEEYSSDLKTDFDRARLKERFDCVKNWVELYAPEDMKFRINLIVSSDFVSGLDSHRKAAITDVRLALDKFDDSNELMKEFKEIINKHGLTPIDFFKMMYGLIISKEKGPKLAGFMLDNRDKVMNLLNQI